MSCKFELFWPPPHLCHSKMSILPTYLCIVSQKYYPPLPFLRDVIYECSLNVDLLIMRLKVMGLPDDIVILIRIWLKEWFFYVSVNGVDSYIKCSWNGIIQGSKYVYPIIIICFIILHQSTLTNNVHHVRWLESK